MSSATEDYVRNLMRPALRRQFQPIALRIIAESGGSADISQIRQAIAARHPDIKWDRRYPIKVLEDNGIIEVDGTTVSFAEELDAGQIASLLSALDERAVRTSGLRVEDTSWRPGQAEWQALRLLVVQRDGEVCAVLGCGASENLELDHRWRGRFWPRWAGHPQRSTTQSTCNSCVQLTTPTRRHTKPDCSTPPTHR